MTPTYKPSIFLQKQAERRAARNAIPRSERGKLSAFGRKLIEDHQRMMDELKSLQAIHGERFSFKQLNEFRQLAPADQHTYRHVPGSWFVINEGEIDFNTIKKIASEAASEVRHIYIDSGGDETWARGKAIELCKQYKIDPPPIKMRQEQRLLRFFDDGWWHRKLRRRLPALTLEYHRKNRHGFKYCDDKTIKALASLRYESLIWMDKQILMPDKPDHEELPLLQVASALELSRQALFFAKCEALQQLAKQDDNTAAMFTITCPGGWRAGKDEYRTIKECRDWLTTIENRVSARRAKLEKRLERKLNVAMLKATQPHKDSTPHRHNFLSGDRGDIMIMETLYKEAALQVLGDELGALEHRFKVDYVEDGKFDLDERDSTETRINFAQYVMRYCNRFALRDISKLDIDEVSTENIEKILQKRREESWYMGTGTRRYSFAGMPPDYVWYAIYRQTHRDYFENVPTDDDGIPLRSFVQFTKEFYHDSLHKIIIAVNNGDYFTFWNEIKRLGFERLIETKKNKYGEEIEQTSGCVILGYEFLLKEIAYKIIEKERDDSWIFDDINDPESEPMEPVGVIYYRPSEGDSLDHRREKDAIPPP